MLPERLRGSEFRSIVGDDEAGTVSGTHSEVTELQRLFDVPKPVAIGDEGGTWNLRDPAHGSAESPGDAGHRLLGAAPRAAALDAARGIRRRGSAEARPERDSVRGRARAGLADVPEPRSGPGIAPDLGSAVTGPTSADDYAPAGCHHLGYGGWRPLDAPHACDRRAHLLTSAKRPAAARRPLANSGRRDLLLAAPNGCRLSRTLLGRQFSRRFDPSNRLGKSRRKHPVKRLENRRSGVPTRHFRAGFAVTFAVRHRHHLGGCRHSLTGRFRCTVGRAGGADGSVQTRLGNGDIQPHAEGRNAQSGH